MRIGITRTSGAYGGAALVQRTSKGRLEATIVELVLEKIGRGT